MQFKRDTLVSLFIAIVLIWSGVGEGKKRKRSYPTRPHPVVLWGQTLSESEDLEQRKVAAFKLSQYTRPIFQNSVIDILIKCTEDSDTHIKVLCTKALSRAENQSKDALIRQTLLKRYEEDATLRNTIVRTLILRQDHHPDTYKKLLLSMQTSQSSEELIPLVLYFEKYGAGDQEFVTSLSGVFKKTSDGKLKTLVIKALADQASGQEEVIVLMAECASSKDTPLALNCLAGLEKQAKGDERTWVAIEKSLLSDDPDVLLATLDVINAQPASVRTGITKRLLVLVKDIDDSDLREKAILGLGIAGDHSNDIVTSVQKILEEPTQDEGLRIAAALVLGKQAVRFPEDPKRILTFCFQQENSKPLKTACQLGLQELEELSKQSAQQTNPPQSKQDASKKTKG